MGWGHAGGPGGIAELGAQHPFPLRSAKVTLPTTGCARARKLFVCFSICWLCFSQTPFYRPPWPAARSWELEAGENGVGDPTADPGGVLTLSSLTL